VYHTGAHPLRAWPHKPEWQLAALALLVIGLLTSAGDGDATVAVSTVAAGLAGLAITFGWCLTYALRSDINCVPRVSGRRPALSRGICRMTIAWLHIVQPFARSYGYLRGTLRRPAAVTGTASPDAERFAPPRERTQVALLLGKAGQYCFWSEAWASGDALLTRVVERLRTYRFGRAVEVDDGWHPDRDISIAFGLWARAQVQALVEDHGTGRCLFRARVQLRPRVGTLFVTALTVAAIVALATSGA
jgi:hypothetical protein